VWGGQGHYKDCRGTDDDDDDVKENEIYITRNTYGEDEEFMERFGRKISSEDVTWETHIDLFSFRIYFWAG
jgi:hypothetical protein